MISYEVSIGLILVPVIICSGSLNLTEIVFVQSYKEHSDVKDVFQTLDDLSNNIATKRIATGSRQNRDSIATGLRQDRDRIAAGSRQDRDTDRDTARCF